MLGPMEVGAISSALGITCGIVAIVCATVAKAKKDKEDSRIRQAIIDNHTDPETAKLLIRDDEKKQKNVFIVLRWALVLLLGGISYLLGAQLFSYSMTWVFCAIGVGLGLLIAFLIEYKLTQKQSPKE